MSARKNIACFSALSLAVLLSAGAAGAATVSFTGFPMFYFPDTDGPWIEEGVTVTPGPGDFGSSDFPDSAHFDDGGGPNTSLMTFTLNRPFRAVSLQALGMGSSYYPDIESCDFDTIPCVTAPYDNVVVAGFRNGVEIFSASFYAGEPGVLTPFTVPAGAGVFDLLTVTNVSAVPSDVLDDFCPDGDCGHFSLDSVVLAPVPLPAAGLLLLGGLAAVGAVGRSKRARTAG